MYTKHAKIHQHVIDRGYLLTTTKFRKVKHRP